MSLQYGDVDSEIAAVQDRLGVTIHRDREIDPFTSAEDWFAQVAAMDHIAHLRGKVERDASSPELILTEPAVGYRLVECD